MEIFLKRIGARLVPINDLGNEQLAELPLDEIIKAKISRPRNVGHHRKFFALVKVVFDNQDHYTNQETMRKVMIMQAGYYDTIKVMKGDTVYLPKSISFGSMDQNEFQEFYERFLDVAVQMLDMECEELSKEVEAFC